jgi:hypothetical protein
VKFLNQSFSSAYRKIVPKSRNYGNYREEWCLNGKEVISAAYFYENKKFDSGQIIISKELISKIKTYFSVKESFIIYVIEEWYEEIMVPKFERIVGENGLSIDDVGIRDSYDCIPEPVKPEGITDEEMIKFIVDNTLYDNNEVLRMIKSGERDLEDFYLDIVDTVNRNKF